MTKNSFCLCSCTHIPQKRRPRHTPFSANDTRSLHYIHIRSRGYLHGGFSPARPIKGRLNPGRLAALRTCYSLLCLRSTWMAFYMKSPCADSRHNRFGISQCYCEAVAHRHGHSYRTVFVLDLNDPCLGIRHADEMSFTISVRYHRGPPFLL